VSTLQLGINNQTSSTSTVSACDSYLWTLNGQTYTASGVYTYVTLNTMGCTQNNELHLTVNQSTASTVAVAVCDQYTWLQNNQAYTQTGTYTVTTINLAGCIHTNALNLTVNNSTANTASVIVCDQYVWPVNGQAYTQSGLYTITSLNASGCLHSSNLNLTVNYSSTSSQTITACDSYMWSFSSQTYTNSGTYANTSLNAFGCLHTANLQLTIHANSNSSSSANACDSYFWLNSGLTYTQSGTYTQTYVNSAGCTHTSSLNLTIFASTNTVLNEIACSSYNWNGITYTQSGIYTHTVINPSGCLHTDSLILSIVSYTTNTYNISACGSYLWPVNGQTYTQSGSYSATVSCGVKNLTLVIYPTLITTNITSNGCYTWAETGQTYTVSGVYSHSAMNPTTGCMETRNLNLIVNPGVLLHTKAMLSGPYIGNGLMQDSLRAKGLIPIVEPYSSSPYNRSPLPSAILNPNNESVSSSILSLSGNNAIVDWVYIELRSPVNPLTVIANKRALIQRDGDIVSAEDGVSSVFVPNVNMGNYYVSIKHRNHLGVMTAVPVYIDNCTGSLIDFSSQAMSVYTNGSISNTPRKALGSGLMGLWSADANRNKNAKYSGLMNDKDEILNALGGAGNINGTIWGYRSEDVNMDGKVRYNGNDNDRAVLLDNIGVLTPNKVLSQHTPN
jgi:hypothetical protein